MALRSIAWRAALGCATWCLLATLAWACPSCRDSLADGPNGNLVRGVFYSIMFMMSMPFLILGGLSAYAYLLVRNARKAQQSQQPQLAESNRESVT